MTAALHPAAGANQRFRRKLETALAHVTAADLMTRDPQAFPATMAVAAFARDVLATSAWSSFPIVDDRGSAVGLVVVRRPIDLSALGDEGLTLHDIAIPFDQLTLVTSSATALDILSAPVDRSAGRVLVQDGGRLVGIITPRDLADGLGWRNLSWEVRP